MGLWSNHGSRVERQSARHSVGVYLSGSRPPAQAEPCPQISTGASLGARRDCGASSLVTTRDLLHKRLVPSWVELQHLTGCCVTLLRRSSRRLRCDCLSVERCFSSKLWRLHGHGFSRVRLDLAGGIHELLAWKSRGELKRVAVVRVCEAIGAHARSCLAVARTGLRMSLLRLITSVDVRGADRVRQSCYEECPGVACQLDAHLFIRVAGMSQSSMKSICLTVPSSEGINGQRRLEACSSLGRSHQELSQRFEVFGRGNPNRTKDTAADSRRRE